MSIGPKTSKARRRTNLVTLQSIITRLAVLERNLPSRTYDRDGKAVSSSILEVIHELQEIQEENPQLDGPEIDLDNVVEQALAAFRNGEPITANPYDPKTQEAYWTWETTWDVAQRDSEGGDNVCSERIGECVDQGFEKRPEAETR